MRDDGSTSFCLIRGNSLSYESFYHILEQEKYHRYDIADFGLSKENSNKKTLEYETHTEQEVPYK